MTYIVPMCHGKQMVVVITRVKWVLCHYCLYCPQYFCFKSGIICTKRFHSVCSTCTSVQFWNWQWRSSWLWSGCITRFCASTGWLSWCCIDTGPVAADVIMLTLSFVFCGFGSLVIFPICMICQSICPCFPVWMLDYHTWYTLWASSGCLFTHEINRGSLNHSLLNTVFLLVVYSECETNSTTKHYSQSTYQTRVETSTSGS